MQRNICTSFCFCPFGTEWKNAIHLHVSGHVGGNWSRGRWLAWIRRDQRERAWSAPVIHSSDFVKSHNWLVLPWKPRTKTQRSSTQGSACACLAWHPIGEACPPQSDCSLRKTPPLTFHTSDENKQIKNCIISIHSAKRTLLGGGVINFVGFDTSEKKPFGLPATTIPRVCHIGHRSPCESYHQFSGFEFPSSCPFWMSTETKKPCLVQLVRWSHLAFTHESSQLISTWPAVMFWKSTPVTWTKTTKQRTKLLEAETARLKTLTFREVLGRKDDRHLIWWALCFRADMNQVYSRQKEGHLKFLASKWQRTSNTYRILKEFSPDSEICLCFCDESLSTEFPVVTKLYLLVSHSCEVLNGGRFGFSTLNPLSVRICFTIVQLINHTHRICGRAETKKRATETRKYSRVSSCWQKTRPLLSYLVATKQKKT